MYTYIHIYHIMICTTNDISVYIYIYIYMYTYILDDARALAACLPRQDHIYITTDKLFRFHHNRFDEMPCKLDST